MLLKNFLLKQYRLSFKISAVSEKYIDRSGKSYQLSAISYSLFRRVLSGNVSFKTLPKYFAIGLLLLTVGLSVFAQKNAPVKDILVSSEKNIEQGKLEETERPLIDYALAHPQDLKALELVGRLRLRQGRFEEARSLYQKVLAADSKFTLAKINYVSVLLQLGETGEAREVLSQINEGDPANPAANLDLARSLTLVGDFQKARAVTDKLPVAVKNTDALPVIAVCDIGLGEKQKIDALLPLAKKIAPSKPELVVKLADVLLNGRMPDQAIDLLKTVVTVAPKNLNALLLLSKAEIYTKNFVQAKQHLDRAALLQPRSAEVFYTQAMLESVQGNTAATLDLLNKALSFAPDSVTILKEIVVSSMRASQAAKAAEAAEKLVSLHPDEPEFYYLYGAASLQRGDLDKAQSLLVRFTELRPGDSRGCLALGLTLAAQPAQIELARQQLRHCLEIDPANYEAKYQLGLSYKAQGDTATAIQLLEDVIAGTPNYALALRDLGTLYLQAGAETKAQAVLERSVALNPNDADTHFQLSRLYNLIGKSDLAQQHLQMFQKIKNGGKASP